MKKILLLVLSTILSTTILKSENDAIYVWIEGQSTCYKLSSRPRVTYSKDDTTKTVILTLSEESIPVLTLRLTDKTSNLRIVYGQYDASKDPAVIEKIMDTSKSKVVYNGKFIRGGQLIIVKDGKQYNIKGNRIN